MLLAEEEGNTRNIFLGDENRRKMAGSLVPTVTEFC